MPQNFPLGITNIFSNLIVEYGYACKTYIALIHISYDQIFKS